jgi:copper chaperone CopZ
MDQKTFIITDMHCPNCAMILEGIEDKLPGIKSISVSYKQGKMTVEFDPQLVSEREILSIVEKFGYHTQS